MTFFKCGFFVILMLFCSFLKAQTLSVQDRIRNLYSIKNKDVLVNLESYTYAVQGSLPVEFLRISFLHLPNDNDVRDFSDGGRTNKKLRSMYMKIRMDIEDALKQSQIHQWRWIKENIEDSIIVDGKEFKITYSNLVYVVPVFN